MRTAVLRVRESYSRTRAVNRPEVWIALRPEEDALADAERVDAAIERGEHLPLAGVLVAVKDNVDVAGLPTTAGCPEYAYHPEATAPCVARLVEAGAVVLGKTNLDQFATGLVGTRSPYGAVRNAWLPDRVAGGSSSGSAVAVALGVADLGIGTDTAGSGRIPAAFQGIVGFKPTRGRISTEGVVPASRSYDCVSVFARSVAEAELAVELMSDAAWPAEAPLGAPPAPVVAVPEKSVLRGEVAADWAAAFELVVERLASEGVGVLRVGLEPFLEGARFLYETALVAERYAAVGAFVDEHPDSIDPSVAAIIGAAHGFRAHELVRDLELLEAVRTRALAAIDGADGLLLPTAPKLPTIAAVERDPIELNRRLGRLCAFANPFRLSAVAVPAGYVGGVPFGVTVFARGFADRVAADLARRICREPAATRPGGCLLMVFGAHLSGQPLNGQLLTAGASLVRRAHTAARYRMFALDTEPPKPGLLEVGAEGVPIEGELWQMPAAGLGSLLASLPEPMTLGSVALEDGSCAVGFFCHASATLDAEDISGFGGWRAYLGSPVASPTARA